jgi:hypothetical protein
MVYSQICEWLNDFVEAEPPEELVDTWDCTEWIQDSEIIEMFKEHVLPTYKTKKARDDSEQILLSLIWEYYLFRQASALNKYVYNVGDYERLKALPSVPQQSAEWLLEKYDLLTASEFSSILTDGLERNDLIREKTRKRIRSVGDGQQTVFLTSTSGKLPPMAWGHRFEPVVRKIYEATTSTSVYTGLGRVRHPDLDYLAASPDGVISTGSLLEIKAPISRDLEKDIIPYDYYCQMQIQMEVCDVGICTYCECRFNSGDAFTEISSVEGLPAFVGALAVYGVPNNSSTWKYIYSPLFLDTKEGRLNALAWTPSVLAPCDTTDTECEQCVVEMNNITGDDEIVLCERCMHDDYVVLEKKVWQIIDWQTIKVLRNKRWWTTVGFPGYNRFTKDVDAAKADPMFLTPRDSGRHALQPMFVDEDTLYNKNTIE